MHNHGKKKTLFKKSIIAFLLLCLYLETFSDEMICCGNREVWIHDVDIATGEKGPKIWLWTENDSPQILQYMKGKFRCPDECKPIRRGEYILITSSYDGVAIIHRKTKRATFWGLVGNAHSADLLPNNRILVAGSTGSDKLFLFDEDKPKEKLWNDDCYSCHGVVWDDERQLAYALSSSTIQVYTLTNWDTDNPSLTKVEDIQMPAGGGHDMFPVPNTSKLSISTGGNVWLFDRDTKEFEPHPDIPNLSSVKSVNNHPATNQVMYTKSTISGGTNTYHIQFLNPDFTVEVDQKTYKARWNVQLGCTDPLAINYDSLANYDDSSCEYVSAILEKVPFVENGDFVFSIKGMKQKVAVYGDFKSVVIIDMKGRMIKTFPLNNRHIIWDRSCDKGKIVPVGIYWILFRGTNKNYVKKLLLM